LKTSTLVLLIIVIVGVVIGGLYYNGTQTKSPVSEPSSIPSPSSSLVSEPSSIPSLMPIDTQSAMINEIWSLVLKVNATYYDYYPFDNIELVRGKVMVFSAFDTDPAARLNVENLLPSEMIAEASDENVTMFAIFNPRDGRSTVYVAAIYWPEKILVGPEPVFVNYAKDNAVNTALAEWILDLPKINSLPAFTIIDDIRNVILNANSTYQSSPYEPLPTISGKVMVYNFVENQQETNVENDLSSELELAHLADEKITVFAIVDVTAVKVGFYTSGGDAYQIYWDILVLHYPEKEVVGRHKVIGLFPPAVIDTGWRTGDIKGPTVEWILSLPREG
jgi:hypothetical protein